MPIENSIFTIAELTAKAESIALQTDVSLLYCVILLEEIQNVNNEKEENLRRHLNLRDKLNYKKKNINTTEEKDVVYK